MNPPAPERSPPPQTLLRVSDAELLAAIVSASDAVTAAAAWIDEDPPPGAPEARWQV